MSDSRNPAYSLTPPWRDAPRPKQIGVKHEVMHGQMCTIRVFEPYGYSTEGREADANPVRRSSYGVTHKRPGLA